VHTHHTIEDMALFPALHRANPGLGPVVDKLMADHRAVSRLLDEIEAGANALLMQEGTTIRTQVVDALNALATDLLAHLAFEEEALGLTILKLEGWPL
jgi:hemerythrin-like domain-containing protein